MVNSEPKIIAKYFNAIKVSVDGPRSPRKKYHQEKFKLKKQFDLMINQSSSSTQSFIIQKSSIITEFENYFRQLAIYHVQTYLNRLNCNLSNQNMFDYLVNLVIENTHLHILNNASVNDYDYNRNYEYFFQRLIQFIELEVDSGLASNDSNISTRENKS